MKLLVAHASAHGSTANIAERIAGRLRARGIEVECCAVEQAPPASEFDAVVVGSAIHDGAWLRGAAAFVKQNTNALSTRPTWMFSVGMVGALPRMFRKWATAEGPKVVAPFVGTVRPRGIRLFSGVIREEHLPRLGRALFRVLGGHFGDFTDWSEIDAWADALALELASMPAAA